MRRWFQFAAPAVALTLSSQAAADDQEDTRAAQEKAEQALQNERQKVDQLEAELKERDDAESARRFIRYGVTAGVAYSLYAPLPTATRITAVQGGSVTGYIATFPAYWGWSSPTANYCAAQWSASEDAAKALERLSSVSESVTSKELAEAEAAKKQKIEGLLPELAKVKDALELRVKTLAPACDPGTRPPKGKDKIKEPLQWEEYCQFDKKRKELSELRKGTTSVPRAELEKRGCKGSGPDPVPAKTDQEVWSACNLEASSKELAEAADLPGLVDAYYKVFDEVEALEKARAEIGIERTGATYGDFKNARVRYRSSIRALSFREDIASAEWKTIEESCPLLTLGYEAAIFKVESGDFGTWMEEQCGDNQVAAKSFESEARRVLELREKTSSGDPTTPAYECLWSKLGLYVGVAASFKASVILPEEPENVVSDRDVSPTVTFGVAVAPNALFTLLTGPMVGSVKRADGTNAPIWAWTVAFGGTLDVVNLLVR